MLRIFHQTYRKSSINTTINTKQHKKKKSWSSPTKMLKLSNIKYHLVALPATPQNQALWRNLKHLSLTTELSKSIWNNKVFLTTHSWLFPPQSHKMGNLGPGQGWGSGELCSPCSTVQSFKSRGHFFCELSFPPRVTRVGEACHREGSTGGHSYPTVPRLSWFSRTPGCTPSAHNVSIPRDLTPLLRALTVLHELACMGRGFIA